MKKFTIKILLFVALLLIIFTASLLFVPNKKIDGNSLFANIDKHNRLDSLPSPKIIFVGGSNLAFGLDCKTISDSLKMPAVNMGLHAGFGLRFPINEVKHAVNQGDIVVLSPTYANFKSRDMLYGEKVLVALLFDVDRKNLRYIGFRQAIHLFPNAVSYSVSKLFPKLDVMQDGVDKYGLALKRASFNEYGDETMHYDWENQDLHASFDGTQKSDTILSGAVDDIVNFKVFVEKRGAKFYIIPPSLQYTESLSHKKLIKNIAKKLSEKNINFAIAPEKCNMADSLFFNSAYHLNKQGVKIYSEMIIKMLLAAENTD
ncbi:MAG: hypothetical protein LBS50_08430 [Prevotellaceae bacterium]|jgi:hypothetical protein|nr:hypothetical protein [Prevotellaceae bacterium]